MTTRDETTKTECSPPLDPNELPVSRPSSALSGSSDFSGGVDGRAVPGDFDPPTEWIPPRLVRAVIRGHKGACILCGRTEDVLLHRVIMHHDEGAISTNSLPWLKCLGLIEQDYTSDTYSNIMLLCRPHVAAWDAGVWRLVPSHEERVRMRHQPVVVHDPADSDSDDHGSSDANAGISVSFDVVIFVPGAMPPVQAPGTGANAGASTDAPTAKCNQRVLRKWRNLPLDPYIVFASALPLIGAVYWPPPDKEIREIETECLEIREAWNSAVPREDITLISGLAVWESAEQIL
ncbi:hypothetical protein OH77DRAFT_1413245 [Trametes cingulata]|nr:hypothetical protein OH77DRAFT_1413245 [Trametes cingulata]